MNKIKLLETRIETRWPMLESKLSRITVMLAITNLIAVCVWIALRRYH